MSGEKGKKGDRRARMRMGRERCGRSRKCERGREMQAATEVERQRQADREGTAGAGKEAQMHSAAYLADQTGRNGRQCYANRSCYYQRYARKRAGSFRERERQSHTAMALRQLASATNGFHHPKNRMMAQTIGIHNSISIRKLCWLGGSPSLQSLCPSVVRSVRLTDRATSSRTKSELCSTQSFALVCKVQSTSPTLPRSCMDLCCSL